MRVTSDIYMIEAHNRRAAQRPLWLESAAENEDLAAFGITREEAETLARTVAMAYKIVSPKGRSPDSVLYTSTHNEFSVHIRNRMRSSEESLHFTQDDMDYILGRNIK